MSFLAWAYALGALAVSLPILFHLIRRSPQGERKFSSLMFLDPSPPRLTRASRLDNLLLLLLRALALLLIAAAFMRPFFRQYLDSLTPEVPGRVVALLLDTSASMNRPEVWKRATAEVEQVLQELEPRDQVALLAFDRQVRTLVPWPDERSARDGEQSAAALLDLQREQVRRLVKETRPTFAKGELGAALVHVADRLEALRNDVAEGTRFQIVVVSDFQQGADLAALQEFQWPGDIPVETMIVEPADTTNASLRLLAERTSSGEPIAGDEAEVETQAEVSDEQYLRVRVRNERSSSREQFHVRWETEDDGGASAKPLPDPIPVYVPPGESRVVAVPREPLFQGASRLRLTGDSATFDNTCYVVPERQERVRVLYVGTDTASDAEGLRYYLNLVFDETPRRQIEVEAIDPAELASGASPLMDDEAKMLVLAQPLEVPQWEGVERYVEAGGALLVILSSPEVAASFADWNATVEFTGSPASSVAVATTDYALLAEIDFTHPVFTPFANPRYNDFTKIHFWRYQACEVDESEEVDVIARFDSGHPAMWEESRGAGRIFAMASGWRPSDSQLAVSSKFVPLLWTILEQALGGPPLPQSFRVDDVVRLPENLSADALALARESADDGPQTQLRVTKPDRSDLVLPAAERRFDAADQPGIYRVAGPDGTFEFAVNLDPAESLTDPLSVSQLEQLGVVLGTAATSTKVKQQIRQEKDKELEQRQRVWQWLLVGALVLLALETWLAGRVARQVQAARVAS